MQHQIQYSQSNVQPTHPPLNVQPTHPPLNAQPTHPPLNAQPQLVGDMIEQLPTDQTVPSHNEIRIVDTLFQKKKGIIDRVLKNTKDVLILGILFMVFSLPLLDNLIKSFINLAEKSEYILVGIKAILFMISYFIINNVYLIRRKQ